MITSGYVKCPKTFLSGSRIHSFLLSIVCSTLAIYSFLLMAACWTSFHIRCCNIEDKHGFTYILITIKSNLAVGNLYRLFIVLTLTCLLSL